MGWPGVRETTPPVQFQAKEILGGKVSTWRDHEGQGQPRCRLEGDEMPERREREANLHR